MPPLIFDRMQFLNRRKNPWFEHGEAELFVAERDGEPVGRISAQVDQRWDESQGGSDGMFGFFETVDDREVAAALLGAAEEWLRERGRSRLLGPMDFTTNDEVGILIEGYELRPMILQNWHPPFYKELLEELGYGKAMDLLMWYLELGELKEGDQFAPEIHAAAAKALRDEGDRRSATSTRATWREEMRRFTEVYNEAWADNWGFVPATDAEIEFHAKLLKQVIDEDWALHRRKGRRDGRRRLHPARRQPGAGEDGRAGCCRSAGCSSCSASAKIDRVRVFALGVKDELPPQRRRRRPLPEAPRGGEPRRRPRRRDRLDPRDQRADEPGDGRDGRRRWSRSTASTRRRSPPLKGAVSGFVVGIRWLASLQSAG